MIWKSDPVEIFIHPERTGGTSFSAYLLQNGWKQHPTIKEQHFYYADVRGLIPCPDVVWMTVREPFRWLRSMWHYATEYHERPKWYNPCHLRWMVAARMSFLEFVVHTLSATNLYPTYEELLSGRGGPVKYVPTENLLPEGVVYNRSEQSTRLRMNEMSTDEIIDRWYPRPIEGLVRQRHRYYYDTILEHL